MTENDSRSVHNEWLAWLADAPMFIDGPQVTDFYDAVLRPRYKTVQLELARERAEQLEKSLGGKLEAKLPTWFPWLKLGAEVEGSVAKTAGETEGETITLEPIENPTRQLVELSLHYLINQPERIWLHQGEEWQLPSEEIIRSHPRMLAALDFPRRSKFLPMAAELNNGQVVTFFNPLVDKLKKDGGTLPVSYPDDTSTEEGNEQRDAYWKWFSEHWSAKKAIQVIEEGLPPLRLTRDLDHIQAA